MDEWGTPEPIPFKDGRYHGYEIKDGWIYITFGFSCYQGGEWPEWAMTKNGECKFPDSVMNSIDSIQEYELVNLEYRISLTDGSIQFMGVK